MKKFLLAIAALLCVGSVAMAGVNANGTIFLHYNASAVGTDGNFSGYGGLDACANAIVTAPAGGGTLPGAWFAYAAFLPTASPRVAVITAGLLYDDSQIFITAYGKTADGELPTTSPAWPGNGSGIAVQWNNARTATLFEWYWFTGYGYATQLCLGPHPTQGGGFTDDSIPSTTDPIVGYGCLGFGEPGTPACPQEGPTTGACCFPDGSCQVLTADECAAQGGVFQGVGTDCTTVQCPPPPVYGACCVVEVCSIETQADCEAMGGRYLGDGTVCDPNPCVTPVETRSWGQIKNNFR